MSEFINGKRPPARKMKTEKVDCLWSMIGYKETAHRIMWWMLDGGTPGHVFGHGWQLVCTKDLGVHRATIRRQVEIMIAGNILIEGNKKGEVMLNVKVFDRKVDRSLIKTYQKKGK